MSKEFYFKQFNLALVQFKILKTVLFQAIQLSISTPFSSIWPIHMALSGSTTPGQSGPGSSGSEGVLRIFQSSNIAGTSPSDCLGSYPGQALGETYFSAEKSRWILLPQLTGQYKLLKFCSNISS